MNNEKIQSDATVLPKTITVIDALIAHANHQDILRKLAREGSVPELTRTEVLENIALKEMPNSNVIHGATFDVVNYGNIKMYSVMEHIKMGDELYHLVWGMNTSLNSVRASGMVTGLRLAVDARESALLVLSLLHEVVEPPELLGSTRFRPDLFDERTGKSRLASSEYMLSKFF